MATSSAKYALATFAVSAKLHRLLDATGRRQRMRTDAEQLAFDAHLETALRSLEQRKDLPFRRETRHAELSLIKRDFDIVERLYRGFAAQEPLPETVTQRFDRIFSEIREKIRQKEAAA